MKFFLLIIFFALFVVAGFFIYKFYKNRFHLYEDLEFLCKYLKNNISFNKNNLNELFMAISNKLHFSSTKIISAINSNSIYIRNDDKENVLNFFTSLGKGSVDFEINNLNYYENQFNTMKCECKEEVKSKGILYMKLTIILGLTLVILLI